VPFKHFAPAPFDETQVASVMHSVPGPESVPPPSVLPFATQVGVPFWSLQM
jgi:hypothetical protein